MKSIAVTLFTKLIPKTKFGEKIFAVLTFIYFHKRLPNETSNLVDVLHRLKLDGTLYDPLRCFVSDKEYMKTYVKGKVGKGFTIPTIALLSSKQEVERFIAGEACIVKPCHSSGDVIFLNKGEKLSSKRASLWLSHNYYDVTREANYRYLDKRVIVEPILYNNKNLNDYKFFFFDGNFLFLQIDVDRATEHKRSFYDRDFNFLSFSTKYPISSKQPRPSNLAEMLLLATELAKDFKSLIRIDLYTNGSDIRVGEITNCHGSAREKTIPSDKDVLIDEYVKDRS